MSMHSSLDDTVATAPATLWRNRNFLVLWWGQVVSAIGSRMTQLAFPLLVLAASGSPAQAGLISALSSLPAIAMLLPAGALLDRWNRKYIMLWCDGGRAVALGSIVVALLVGRLSLVHLAGVALVEGVLSIFFSIAGVAALPQLVERRHLPQALSVTAVTDHVAGFIGPALSGALYGISRTLPFVVDTVSYVVSVVSLCFISGDFQAVRGAPQGTVWSDMRTGVHWLWRQPLLRALTLVDGGLNLCSMGYALILIVRAQELGASTLAIGLLFATGPVGGMLGALLTPRLQQRFAFGALIAVSTWMWALSWLLYALAPSMLVLGVVNLVGWLIIPIHTVTQASYRLAVVPDALQGRVASVYKLLAYGSQPLSLAVTGWLLQRYGATSTIVLIAAPQVVLAVLTSLNWQLRQMPKLAALQAAGGEAYGGADGLTDR